MKTRTIQAVAFKGGRPVMPRTGSFSVRGIIYGLSGLVLRQGRESLVGEDVGDRLIDVGVVGDVSHESSFP